MHVLNLAFNATSWEGDGPRDRAVLLHHILITLQRKYFKENLDTS